MTTSSHFVYVAVAGTLLIALWGGCQATTHGGLRLADVTGDAHGPGSYVMPQGDAYRASGFDLSEVFLRPAGDALEVSVKFRGPVAQLEGVPVSRDERRSLFLPTVDIYLDLDGVTGSGEQGGLPGRRVRMSNGAGWESVIVLTALPGHVRSALARGERRVEVADVVRVQGRSLRARVPLDVLAGRALADVAVAVAVTGSAWGTTFKGLVDGQVPTSFVREVTRRAGRCDRWDELSDGTPCTFGGCGDACGTHPRVLDALHGVAGVQEAALAEWRTGDGRWARLPWWGSEGGDVADTDESPRYAVLASSGVRVTAVVPGGIAKRGAFWRCLDVEGQLLGLAVVTHLEGDGLIVFRRLENPDGEVWYLEPEVEAR